MKMRSSHTTDADRMIEDRSVLAIASSSNGLRNTILDADGCVDCSVDGSLILAVGNRFGLFRRFALSLRLCLFLGGIILCDFLFINLIGNFLFAFTVIDYGDRFVAGSGGLLFLLGRGRSWSC